MNTSDWNKVKGDFVPNGSLRDIYIFEVTHNEWNILIEAIIKSDYKICFEHGQKSAELPRAYSEIRSLQETDPTILKIWLHDKIQIHCHFFVESEIELDLDPKEIASETDFHRVVKFMQWLSNLLKRKVRLTHENSPGEEIIEI